MAAPSMPVTLSPLERSLGQAAQNLIKTAKTHPDHDDVLVEGDAFNDLLDAVHGFTQSKAVAS